MSCTSNDLSFFLSEPFYLSHAGGFWLAGAGGWLRNGIQYVLSFSYHIQILFILVEFFIVNDSQLAASSFAETDDNGVWIPKKADVSFGTNGFKLEFKQTGTSANSSGIGADTSGNDNHFAVSNLAATDVTTDTPTNNFSTFNVLAKETKK